MSDTPEAGSAAIQAVAEVAIAAEDHAAISETILDNVIEQSQERIDEAQEVARQIAEAAMQTEIGRRVAALEQGEYTWQERHAELQRQLEQQQTLYQEMSQQIAALSGLTVGQIISEQSPSIPANSEPVAEAITETLEILPGAESLSAVVESPEPAPAAKRRTWI